VLAFHQRLSKAGYVDGQNVAVEIEYYSMGEYDQLPVLVADLVDRKVDVVALSGMPSAPALAADLVDRNVGVIVTGGGPLPALAAKNASSTLVSPFWWTRR
jgi:hypothetical protein